MPRKKFARPDGRKADEIRPLSMRVGVIKNADGSAEIRLGGNWIIAAVYGPKEHHPRFKVSQERAILNCRYHMVPYSVPERKSPRPSRREGEISMVIREALAPALILEEFPESGIDVFIEVLQAEGSTRVTSINVAALALAEAGLPMRDLVSACAAGKYQGHIVVDVGEIEDKQGQADLPVALMPNLNQITLVQMDGHLTHDELKEALDAAIGGARHIHEMQTEALKGAIKEMRTLEST